MQQRASLHHIFPPKNWSKNVGTVFIPGYIPKDGDGDDRDDVHPTRQVGQPETQTLSMEYSRENAKRKSSHKMTQVRRGLSMRGLTYVSSINRYLSVVLWC